MSGFLVLIFILLTGCVPLLQYQGLEKKLLAADVEKYALETRLKACEERKAALNNAQKSPAQQIKPEELDDIKKKALEEAERKYKARMKLNELKGN